MKKFANADSSVQCKAEDFLFDKFKAQYGYDDLKQNQRFWLNEEENDFVIPDFYSEKHGIVGEIHTHLGALKPAQKHKVEADILKMLTIEKACGKKFTKYIIVCSEKEKEQLTESNSYLAFTIKFYDIKVEYYPLSDELQAELEETVRKQDMYGKGTENA